MKSIQNNSLNLVLLQIVGPVLIMLMVSSLVFFLVEVIYRGPHTARMYWVLGLFTFASVLVARISIEEGRERAQLFGWALAIATLITSIQLIEFSFLAILSPLVLIGLIFVVMWTSNKLTWDCTVVDNSRDVSSSGLLERLKSSWSDRSSELDSQDSGWSKFRQLLMTGSHANTPGTWVIYFALVAFPVFGIGQWFVRAQAATWIYVLFAVYFAAALGLLLTTSLLGLERYLARRGTSVPQPIARNWMMVGGVFALAVMLAVTLLPKPAGVSSVQDALAALNSPIKKTSKLAPGKDGEEEEPDAANNKLDPDAERTGNEGQNGDEPGDEDGADGGGGDGETRNQKNGEDSQDQQKPADRDKNRRANQDEKSNKDETADETADESKKDNNSPNNPDRGQLRDRKPQQQKPRPQKPEQPNQRRQQDQSPPKQFQNFLDAVSKAISWLIYLIGFIAAIVLLYLFRDEIAKFWSLLFARKKSVQQQKKQETVAAPVVPDVPFSHFQDPFGGGAANMSTAKLVQYSLLALEAWGREFNVRRTEDETPSEFVRRLEVVDPQVSRLGKSLSDLYNRYAFSSEQDFSVDLSPIKDLWHRMKRKAKRGNESLKAISG